MAFQNSKALNVYLGWDSRASVAFDVARASIVRRTSHPLRVMPIKLGHLDMFTRPVERRDGNLWCPISEAPMSTEFAISRFCVPFLQQTGWALFADCDVLCWSDIAELFALADDRFAVMVVKHLSKDVIQSCYPHGRQLETPATKMDGQAQIYYARKNWSSVVLWNCDHPANKRFHVEHLNTWPGRDLHAFKWLDDSEIGSLPAQWNWLVNVEPYVTDQLIIQSEGTAAVIETESEPIKQGIWHYTLGGPWFQDWKPADHDEAWTAEYELQKPHA